VYLPQLLPRVNAERGEAMRDATFSVTLNADFVEGIDQSIGATGFQKSMNYGEPGIDGVPWPE
jgi:hypothetical protein